MPRYDHKSRLDSTFELVSQLDYNGELQAHFSRYLCVLVSGYIEQSIREIYGEYADSRSSPPVARVVARYLERFQNPKMEPLLQLTGAFDGRWREELEAYAAGQRKDAVDSIVNNRNQIAHGESVGLTYHRLREWYRSVIEVVRFVEEQCE